MSCDYNRACEHLRTIGLASSARAKLARLLRQLRRSPLHRSRVPQQPQSQSQSHIRLRLHAPRSRHHNTIPNRKSDCSIAWGHIPIWESWALPKEN
jgi:hypothetical protein